MHKLYIFSEVSVESGKKLDTATPTSGSYASVENAEHLFSIP